MRTKQQKHDSISGFIGATAVTYVLVAADAGAAIKFRVTGNNWSGSETETSAATAAVAP